MSTLIGMNLFKKLRAYRRHWPSLLPDRQPWLIKNSRRKARYNELHFVIN